MSTDPPLMRTQGSNNHDKHLRFVFDGRRDEAEKVYNRVRESRRLVELDDEIREAAHQIFRDNVLKYWEDKDAGR